MRQSAQQTKLTPLHTSINSFFPPITIKNFLPVAEPAFALFLIGSCITIFYTNKKSAGNFYIPTLFLIDKLFWIQLLFWTCRNFKALWYCNGFLFQHILSFYF